MSERSSNECKHDRKRSLSSDDGELQQIHGWCRQVINISIHNVLRKTAKHTFYHLIDIAVVNSHIIYNWFQIQNLSGVLSESQFRDFIVLEIITQYGTEQRQKKTLGRRSRTYKVSHGSKLYPSGEKAVCVYCRLHGKKPITQRKCPDCNLNPALCQTLERDCHSAWHSDTFAMIRQMWYEHVDRKEARQSAVPAASRGRPRGSINRRRCRGNYQKN